MRWLSRSPVLQFVVSGLIATLLVGLVAVVALRREATQEAIRDAKRVTSLVGTGVIEPRLTDRVMAGDDAALDRLDELVRTRVLREGIVRVKLWSADGRVVYSDEPKLVGRRFGLGEDERAALRHDGVEAKVSDLSGPENAFERDADGGEPIREKLLEVYLPLRSRAGEPVLFEAYQRFSSVSASGHDVWLAFAPALIGGLLILQLVNLPLARSLARRLEQREALLREVQVEREKLLRRALDASRTERRLIAADLHDGVVQDLVGVAYALAAEAEALNGDGHGPAGTALRQGAAMTRDSIRALRTLLVDIYPPSLHDAGLHAALEDLATTHGSRGVDVQVRVPEDLDLDAPTEQLLFRCAQEALRNVHKHAGARHVRVDVRVRGPRVTMNVTDDGRGFDPAQLPERRREGHVGLRALDDLVAQRDGHLDVASTPGAGTTVRVDLPRRPWSFVEIDDQGALTTGVSRSDG